MKIRFLSLLLFGLSFLPLPAAAQATIYLPSNGTMKTRLAAQEIRRYFYLRTGLMAQIKEWQETTKPSEITFFLCIGSTDLPDVPGRDSLIRKTGTLEKEAYFISSISNQGTKLHLVVGGDDAGLLYGAYALAEQMGVRFYLHGDIVPDGTMKPEAFAVAEKTGRPLFPIRGIQPFHDFPEGPDWWTEDDYKAVFSQLLKLKMNFFGLHTYPEGGVGPEPLVWIGLREDINPDGSVKTAYPARHFTNANGTWGFVRRLTSAYSNKMGDLFKNDFYGTTYMEGIDAWPVNDQQATRLFNRTAHFFRDVFGYARDLGIRTCVGTETPLIIPNKVKQTLAAKGFRPDDSATTQRLYEGMFEWVKKNYPIDYYWFWTPEDWTWRENTREELQKTRTDLEAALRAARGVNAPFTLSTCGWVLGPINNRSYFDQFLPKSWPMSCINRYVGFEPIEADFARTKGRPTWAIPWLEDDPALQLPQLWAGRMRRDAVDAAAYGCTGLIGIHWRTRILGPNLSALASAAWEQPWNPSLGTSASHDDAMKRKATMNLDYPVDDFYLDWARSNFGVRSAVTIARIFAELDGGPQFVPNAECRTHLPRPANWKDGPGGIAPDSVDWEHRTGDYRFIEELDKVRTDIEGESNLERFDYWLNTFKYLRAVGRFACSEGELRRLLAGVEKEPKDGRSRYWDQVLSIRKRQIGVLEEVYTWLIKTISTSAELGTIANWQQHLREESLEKPAKQIEQLMGRQLPRECWPSDKQLAVTKMVVPTVRTAIRKGENLKLKALFYGEHPKTVVVKWKPLGGVTYQSLEFTNVTRNVYEVSIPAASIADDIEYSISAVGKDGAAYRFPATSEKSNQTVVVY